MTSVASRALIYLNNGTVGDMVMIAVGMAEVSTCEFNKDILAKMQEVTPQDTDDFGDGRVRTWIPADDITISVKKGDELGMFHFGGSPHCLVFGPNVHLKFWRCAMPLDTEEDYFVPLNAILADVVKERLGRLYPL
jgi:phosphatidylserine decarboxylase